MHVKAPEELRIELKAWEQGFARANGGRKPGREDIGKNAAIAAKYKEYNILRKKSAKAQTTPKKTTQSTPKKARHSVLEERAANAVAATPSKTNADVKGSQPPALSVGHEEEPTPACVRLALGPTPQKDGAVLGIFDMLSAGTPSKADIALNPTSDSLIAGTPSKSRALPSSDPQLSKTPQSSGKRFYLDAFAGTPLKRKRDGEENAPDTVKKLFATPSFLRRSWSLAPKDESMSEPTATGAPPFKKRPLVRSLSTIIQGLKKQEEDRMDDEWDIMNEMEAEERGEAPKAAPPKVLVEDSQAAEMPLGPDQGVESNESEGDADPGALDGNGNPRKVWKKKGLKRQTRRVIMRPVLQKARSAPAALDQGEQVVEETQVPERAPRRPTVDEGDGDGDFVNEDDSDEDGRLGSQHKRQEKAAKQLSKTKKKTPEDDDRRKPKKVKPEAHANYRKLKIKNKNSKANGRGGRFGRR